MNTCSTCNNRIEENAPYSILVSGDPYYAEKMCSDCVTEKDYYQYLEKGIINSKLMMNLAIGVFDPPEKREHLQPIRLTADPQVVKDLRYFNSLLEVIVLTFEGKVWFDNGLRDFINKQSHSQLSGHFKKWHGIRSKPTYDGFEMDIRCCSTAGRFLITFEATHRNDNNPKHPAPHTSLTFITEEGSNLHRMGVQSMFGKSEDILSLGNIAIYHWGQTNIGPTLQDDESIEFNLSYDKNVSIL